MIIPVFRKQTNKGILKVMSETRRWKHVDCMNLKGFCEATTDMPIYAFVKNGEVVILMIDWREKPLEELADENDFAGQPPLYFDSRTRRISPVWRLSEFIRHYKQAMADAQVETPRIWGILVSNSTFINHDDMITIWKGMDITVYHGFGSTPLPSIHFNYRFHAEALLQYKAFRLYCERMGFLERDPYAFEDIDADYDEMEFGIEDEDDDADIDIEDYLSEIDDMDDEPAQLETGTVKLGGENMVSVEILNPISSPREELDKLVGCKNIKSQIDDLLELSRYNHLMTCRYPNWKQHNVSLHAIFFGRPGTGKTTVCKIYGGLLKEAGVLSEGHVVVCNRSTFIGNNWGDEEKSIRQVLAMAQGGVLMIDEAYLLSSSHPNDPGKLILPLLMDILSNEQQRDLAIVLCGYKEPMLRLLDLNPGLTSRFPNRFEFEDFTIDELVEISLHRISEHHYHFTPAGLRKYKALLTEAYTLRNPQTWGNARFVANLLEHIYLLHAKRCMHSHSRDAKSFLSITPSDIQPIEVPKEKRRIGF